MTASGARIIAALEDAQRGDFARITVEGQTWVRKDALDSAVGSLMLAQLALRAGDKDGLIHVNDALKALTSE